MVVVRVTSPSSGNVELSSATLIPLCISSLVDGHSEPTAKSVSSATVTELTEQLFCFKQIRIIIAGSISAHWYLGLQSISSLG